MEQTHPPTHLEASSKNSIQWPFHRLLCKNRRASLYLAIAVPGGCGLGGARTTTPHSGGLPGVSPQPQGLAEQVPGPAPGARGSARPQGSAATPQAGCALPAASPQRKSAAGRELEQAFLLLTVTFRNLN